MNRSRRLKVAYISSNDAFDKKSLSGSSYLYGTFLNEHFGDVDYIDNFRPNKFTIAYLLRNIFRTFTWLYIIQKIKEIYWKQRGYAFVWEKTEAISRYYGRLIRTTLEGKKYDLIFSEKGSYCIAHLDTQIPIIYATDATFKAMENYYPEFMNPAKSFSKDGNKVEQMAADKAKLIIATNHWAANSMVKDYGIDPKKIKVVVLPGFVTDVPAGYQAPKAGDRKVCRLLFVGVDWVRKGGDIAVEAVDWLNRVGVPARLTVCGCTPPIGQLHNPHVETVGFLDRSLPEDSDRLKDMFATAHFFILPARAECCAQVFPEAMAHSLPIISTNTGGVASAVSENENGVLLDLKAGGEDFGKAIKKLWEDERRYELMRSVARMMYEAKMSPTAWSSSMKKALSAL